MPQLFVLLSSVQENKLYLILRCTKLTASVRLRMLETWYVFVTEEILNNKENVNFRYC
jgi:hypothetical protein